MLFNSIDFAIFLPIVFVLYWFVANKNHKLQNLFLVTASYLFYGWWDWRFLSLILFSTTIDFGVGIGLSGQGSQIKRNLLLWTSILVNLGLLGFFKYYNFFLDSFITAFLFFGTEIEANSLNVLLPVGISFYTFQTLSYTIDVYRGTTKPEKQFGIFALFVAFFPQLVAGPIERSSRLLPQFHRKVDFDYDRTVSGLRLIFWGLFKKMVIADRLAIYVDQVYGSPESYTGFPLILATYFFAFQIYCDFSGYSDIAIGAARILGYDLCKNFRQPYFSASVAEFWKRWHISLSTWFRDYLYIPLGGNRVARWRGYCNLFIVFLVSGLWHGASWTFVLWGALHGLYLIFFNATSHIQRRLISHLGLDRRSELRKVLSIFATFHIVVFSWIFFRASSISDIFLICQNILQFDGYSLNAILTPLVASGHSTFAGFYEFTVSIFAICFLIIIDFLHATNNLNQYLFSQSLWLRWSAYYIIGLGFIMLGIFDSQTSFIYFQF